MLRPRLLEKLRSRFERPLTVVLAQAGFGKTTLLRQAVDENAISPLGVDHWLTCQADDSTLSFLAGGAFTALGADVPVPDDPREAAVAIADAIWATAPQHVALILDDAHLIAPDSLGAQLLTMLVEELPLNGHVVVAARPEFRFGTSRMVASGLALEIKEEELLFQHDEMTQFADSRGVPVEVLGGVGSWPGLVELTATVGSESVVSYLWEELLAQFPRERRRALGVLVAVGGADAEMAEALLGPEVDLDRVLDGLPLVVRAASGWRSLHGMWARALQHQLDSAEVAEMRRTAGLVLARRRQYHDAMDLLLDAGAWDDVRALITEVCEVCTPLVHTDVLEVWERRLPHELEGTPEQLLLAGMVAEPTHPHSAEHLLEQALDVAPDGSAVRYACLNALIQLAFWRSDRGKMKFLWAQLTDFAADGHPEALGWVALLTALLEPRPERVREALAAPALLSHQALNPVQDWLHAHIVLLKLGDPERAEPLARRALAHETPTMVAVSRSALADSLRLRGRLSHAEELVPDLLRDLVAAKVLTSPELVTQVVVLLQVLGRREESLAVLEDLLPTVEKSPVAWAPIAWALAKAFHEVSCGEEATGVEALRAMVGQPVVRNEAAVVQVSATALPLIYVLAPEIRDAWDAQAQPGCFTPLHALVRALVHLRDTGSTRSVKRLEPAAREIMRATLPIPWVTELAVGLVACGEDAGRELLEDLGNLARPTLHQQLNGPHQAIAATARKLLREMPAVPTRRLRLRTLGSLELSQEGEPVKAPELRRERVRQLLGFLVTHNRTTRAAVIAELWPDLDEAAGGRNLRVTLTYLQNLLEPDRGPLDPPYFVRSQGSVLQLVIDSNTLEVDVIAFEQHLEDAGRLERQGALSAALAAYSQATELWGGDFLADVNLGESDWLAFEQERLRAMFVMAANRAGNLYLARGESVRAQMLGERALLTDPWSENAYQLLASVHLEVGDRDGARQLLVRCRTMLESLGVRPQPQTLTLERKLDSTG